MFFSGLEKTAAFGGTRRVLNKLKGLFTGNETLYHNTSARNARRIRKEGLVPGRGLGMAKMLGIKDKRSKIFLAPNPDTATSMGKSIYATHNFKKIKNTAAKIPLVGSKLEELANKIPKSMQKAIGYLTSHPKSVSGVQLKVEIPKKKLNKIKTSTDIGPWHEVAVNKKIPRKYIK